MPVQAPVPPMLTFVIPGSVVLPILRLGELIVPLFVRTLVTRETTLVLNIWLKGEIVIPDGLVILVCNALSIEPLIPLAGWVNKLPYMNGVAPFAPKETKPFPRGPDESSD